VPRQSPHDRFDEILAALPALPAQGQGAQGQGMHLEPQTPNSKKADAPEAAEPGDPEAAGDHICCPTQRTRKRIRTKKIFTVVSYGLRIFGCKNTQLCVTRCERYWPETPSVRDAVQRSENTRKNSFLNYESPALTAELQARIIMRVKHSSQLVTNIKPTTGGQNSAHSFSLPEAASRR